jgi:uncharacterized membrane protein YccC
MILDLMNRLLEATIAGILFFVIWLVWRTDQLERRIEAVRHELRVEIARRTGHHRYAEQLEEKQKEDILQQYNDKRMFWIIWGTIGATVAIGLFLLHR